MSVQNALSRREALSLLGVTTGSVVATTLTAQAAGLDHRKSSALQRRRARGTSLATGR